MAERSASGQHEKVQIVTARRVYTCWAVSEQCKAPGDGYDDEPVCQRSIGVGVEHVKSTIYPGHDSGYAAAGPLSTRHCMPCARRWTNLSTLLAKIPAPATERPHTDG
jgi:hypothetical protein